MIFDPNTDFPSSEEVIKDPNSINAINLNGQRYLFAVWLDNGKQKLQIPSNYLNELKIIDTLAEFKTSGSLTYKDPNLSVSRLFSKLNAIIGEGCIKEPEESEAQKVTDFTFRGSGSERIHIKLLPIAGDGDVDVLNTQKKMASGDWTIKQTFVITKIENIPSPLSAKVYKIDFEDVITHVLKNYRITEFPCASIGRNGIPDGTVSEYDPQNNKVNTSTKPAKPEVESKESKETSSEDKEEITIPTTTPPEENAPNTAAQAASGASSNTTTTPASNGNLPDYPTQGEGKTNVRAAKTGEAIYWIIHKALTEYHAKTGFDVRGYLPQIEFKDGGYAVSDSELKNKKTLRIKTKTGMEKKVLDKNPEDVWDFGPNDSLLFTTLNGVGNTYMLLDKFLKIHVSGVEHEKSEFLDPKNKSLSNLNWEPCILHKSRSSDENDNLTITLRPISSWMNNLGSLDGNIGDEYMDSFTFKNEEDFINKTLGTIKGFINNLNFCENIDAKVKNVATPIDSFVYDPLSPEDSNKFIVSHIAEHTGPRKTYIAEVEGNFVYCKAYVSELYVKAFAPKKDSKHRYGMVNIDDDQNLKNQDTKIRIQNRIETRASLVALGRNRLIKNIIFFNDLLSFRIEGSTHRQSGNFFSVDLVDGSDPNDDNLNRLLGAWWCARVTHEFDFRDQTYINEITGVKFYRYNSDLSEKELESLKNLPSGNVPNTTPTDKPEDLDIAIPRPSTGLELPSSSGNSLDGLIASENAFGAQLDAANADLDTRLG